MNAQFTTLDSIIKAQPSELICYLDEVSTYKGKFSWLIKPENNNKLCLVAHIDTVFENRLEEKEIIKEGYIWHSTQGICGDDRCGIFALLEIYRKLPVENRPMLLFCDGEESGGVGAFEACEIFKEQLSDVSYFIELDRQGKNDMVFYNREPYSFREYIGKYGFTDSIGSFSDISILGRKFNKCSVNLSVGYYNQHSLQEYIKCSELVETMNKVYRICIDETGHERWDK